MRDSSDASCPEHAAMRAGVALKFREVYVKVEKVVACGSASESSRCNQQMKMPKLLNRPRALPCCAYEALARYVNKGIAK